MVVVQELCSCMSNVSSNTHFLLSSLVSWGISTLNLYFESTGSVIRFDVSCRFRLFNLLSIIKQSDFTVASACRHCQHRLRRTCVFPSFDWVRRTAQHATPYKREDMHDVGEMEAHKVPQLTLSELEARSPFSPRHGLHGNY